MFRPTSPNDKFVVDVSMSSFGGRGKTQGNVKLVSGTFASVRPPSIDYAEFCCVPDREPSGIVCLGDDEQLYRVTLSTTGDHSEETDKTRARKPEMAPALDLLTPFGRLVNERATKLGGGDRNEPGEWKPSSTSVVGKTSGNFLDRVSSCTNFSNTYSLTNVNPTSLFDTTQR